VNITEILRDMTGYGILTGDVLIKFKLHKETFEDTKWLFKSRGQTMIYKKLHRTLKIEQHEPHYKRDAPECEQFLLQVLHPSLLL
jgi:hypothetical protein